MGWIVPLLLGSLLLLTLRQSREPLEGRGFLLLRSLFPSWRFFEEVAPGPELRFCVIEGGEQGPWQPALSPVLTRGVLLNAPGNLHLAQQSLVEQLWSDLDGVSVEAAPELTVYRLVQRLIVERMREQGLATPGARYRFRLVSGDGESESDFDSEEHDL
jgi:hypothetical protein